MNPVRQNIIYSYMLRHFLTLDPRHAEGLKTTHNLSDEQIKQMMWRTSPGPTLKLFIEHEFSRAFDLRGIAGFYFDGELWRLNVRQSTLLLPYYRNNLIAGLQVYDGARDTRPFLLTSRNLPQGSRAVSLPKAA